MSSDSEFAVVARDSLRALRTKMAVRGTMLSAATTLAVFLALPFVLGDYHGGVNGRLASKNRESAGQGRQPSICELHVDVRLHPCPRDWQYSTAHLRPSLRRRGGFQCHQADWSKL